MIKKTQIFPLLLILMDIGAVIVYGIIDHDWRRVIYWIAAAILTATVTF